MENLTVFGHDLLVKNSACGTSPNIKIPTQPRIRLYIKVTDACSAHCKFCANEHSKDFGTLDYMKLEFVIRYLEEKNILHGISLTGGEPMHHPDKVFNILELIWNINPELEVAISTNGENLKEFASFTKVNNLESIHISRHHYKDDINNQIFETDKVASTEDILYLQDNLDDKRIININTMVMKDSIDSLQEIKKMLDHTGELGIYKNGFVSLMKCNQYATNKFINFNDVFTSLDNNFFKGHHFYSQDYCECVDGIYLTNNNKLVEYYARMVKDCNCPYTTQLVYTSDNKVTAGFGKKVLYK